MNTVPAYMTTKITNAVEAETFIRALHADGKLFHFDDSPYTIQNVFTGEATFTEAECVVLGDRVSEMFNLKGFDPFDLACDLL